MEAQAAAGRRSARRNARRGVEARAAGDRSTSGRFDQVASNTVAQSTILWLSSAVWAWLQEHQVDGRGQDRVELELAHEHVVPHVMWHRVMESFELAYNIRNSSDVFSRMLPFLTTSFAYFDPNTPRADASEVNIVEQDRGKFSALRRSFERQSAGDAAVVDLADYIEACWSTFRDKPDQHYFPYTSIVQSSGYGKSKLLYELARQTSDPSSLGLESASIMRLLYVCVRETLSPTPPRFPIATPALRSYLFPTQTPQSSQDVDHLAGKLYRFFKFAFVHWDIVGTEWLELFVEQAADSNVLSSLLRFDHQSHVINQSQRPCDDASNSRLLIFAVDEARSLLTKNMISKQSWFTIMRKALTAANRMITEEFGAYAGIFAVVADTSSKIANFAPRFTFDATQQRRNPLFTPFVLTHTVDVHFEAWIRSIGLRKTNCYRGIVANPRHKSEDYLTRMGRPLWKSLLETSTFNDVIALAAQKILCGKTGTNRSDFDPSTQNGVASMLCRLGVRPYPWSALAARCVSDFGATLSFVNGAHDCNVSLFASEPMLAFGAAFVWYKAAPEGNHHAILEDLILPELGSLMLNEVVDTGGAGELVARIMLLLAMDTVSAMHGGSVNSRVYSGSLFSVLDFMRVLEGKARDVKVMDKAGLDVSEKHIGALKDDWKKAKGKIGFGYFVQLTKEPTKETLWALLGRRAAALLPRNFKGVDIIIPILIERINASEQKELDVTAALVQVKNRERDSSYPKSASEDMRPKKVFKLDLKWLNENEVIRIYMSLREDRVPPRFYLVDEVKNEVSDDTKSEPKLKEEGKTSDQAALSSAGTRKTTHKQQSKTSKQQRKTEMPKPQTKSTTSKKQSKTKKSKIASGAAGADLADVTSATQKDSQATTASTSYVLCMRGLDACITHSGNPCASFMSPGVAHELRKLLDPLWDVKKYIDRDLEQYGDRPGVSSKQLRARSLRPHVESLIELETTLVECDRTALATNRRPRGG